MAKVRTLMTNQTCVNKRVVCFLLSTELSCWGTVGAEINSCLPRAGRSIVSSSNPGAGQNMDLHALHTARYCAILISAPPVHSSSSSTTFLPGSSVKAGVGGVEGGGGRWGI